MRDRSRTRCDKVSLKLRYMNMFRELRAGLARCMCSKCDGEKTTWERRLILRVHKLVATSTPRTRDFRHTGERGGSCPNIVMMARIFWFAACDLPLDASQRQTYAQAARQVPRGVVLAKASTISQRDYSYDVAITINLSTYDTIGWTEVKSSLSSDIVR